MRTVEGMVEYSVAQRKVLDATSDSSSDPEDNEMEQIAEMTYDRFADNSQSGSDRLVMRFGK